MMEVFYKDAGIESLEEIQAERTINPTDWEWHATCEEEFWSVMREMVQLGKAVRDGEVFRLVA